MSKWLTCFFLCALIVVAPHSIAAREGYFRWVDDEGTVHFSQKPPQGRASEFISTKGGRYLPEDRPQQAAQADEAPTPPAATPQPREQQPEFLEVLPDKDPEECRRAQEMLAALNNNTVRMRLIGDDGKPRLITPEEREEQGERAREAAEIHCE